MASFDALAEAYVRLRARDDGSLERDVIGIVGKAATSAASLFLGKKLIDVGVAGLDELKQAQVVSTQTAVQLRATGQAAGISAAHIDELGQSMLDLAGFDDEAARSAANVLLQFNQIKGTDAFDRVLKDAADLSITLGEGPGGLQQEARTLGLALQDPEKGLRLLRSANIALSASQQDALKAAIAQNDTAKEQDIILGAVEARVHGAADAYGKTLAGSLQRSQEELKNAKAELVGGFAPAIEFGATATTAFAHVLEDMPAALQGTVGGIVFLGGGIASLIQPTSNLLQLINSIRAARAASTASTAADAAAKALDTGATVADAEAQAADAVATEANAAAHVESKVAAGGLSSALGTAGVVGAVALAVGALAIYGNTLNGINVSTKEVETLTRASSEEVNKFLDRLAATKGLSGDLLAAQFTALANQGAAGIGVLQSYRQHLVDTGQDTGQVDAALKGAADSQATYNANVAAGSSTQDDATGATNAYTQALEAQNQQRQTQLTSVRNVYDAQQALTSAEHGVAQAARGITDAERGVDDANRRLEDSYRSVADAQQRVIDAQEALNKALQGASDEELGKANLDLSDAQLRQADALEAVAAAQHQLDKDTRLGRTRALAGDQEALTKAQNDYQRAVFGVTDAQKALNDTAAKGSEQDPAVIQARKDLTTATNGLEDAERSRTDALQGVADAQDRVAEAKDRLNDAYVTEADATAKLTDAEANLYGGSESVNTALRNQIAALQGIDAMLAPGSAARQHLDDYIAHLFVLAGIFDTEPVSTPNVIIQPIPGQPEFRAAGGRLDPNVPTWVGEEEPELAFHNIIYPSGKKRADGGAKGGDTFNDNSITINYPERESSDRALERVYARQSVLNGG